MKIEFDLSFEGYLDARDEHPVAHNEGSLSFYFPRMLLLLFGFFAFITWNPISAIILWSGVLLILAVITIKHFVRRRAIMQHKEELLRDFDQFNSGRYTFEADGNGWRLSSDREEQAHAWEELFMIKESSRILYLVTYSGACTLPKASFTPEQLSQLKTWCECPTLSDVNGEE